uniref:Apoptosis inducing factor mitochondria associated 4 n=1 Tax=Scleropages formosus TaxID=113540 RepID=A0A8C9R2N2_SCLFO
MAERRTTVDDVEPHTEEVLTEEVCHESDLQEGQMMEVEVGQHKVLLVRSGGVYSAIGNSCTHYGAPLSKGALSGGRVRCPWHGACFNVKTGDIEEYPGLDCVAHHKVNPVFLQSLKQPKRVKAMGRRVPAITHTVLLVGGGPAALVCAETLRQENYGGRIIMITKDDLPPYDRTKLSKAMNTENDSILLRRMEFFHEYDIEVWMNKEVKFVNTDKKTVMLNDSSQHHYDQLLIATGSRARDLECPGADLENVTLLRILQEKKVKFYMKDCVTEIKGENGKVKEVILKSGVVLPADIVIAGIGVIPNSEFLFGSSVNLDSRNMVIVDKFMKTNVPDVFSAGDVTSFPLAAYENQRVSLGHWHLAQTQGRVAALNMLNKPAEMKSVPFYWTVLAGKSIRYAGYGEGYTQVILKGKVEELKFLAFYVKDDEVVAAASLNSDPAVSQFAERIAAGKQTTKEQAESEDLSWLKLP